MKRIFKLFVATLCLCNLAAVGGCGNDTESKHELYSNYKPYTRWWWFSADVDKKDVRDQLVWLKDHEFGGVEIAWIYPMFLNPENPHPDFMSKEWSEPVVYAKHVADSLGLGCDFTYGTLWPFSDVNLPEGDQTRTYFDSVEVAKRPYTWDHPKEARILNHLDKEAFVRYADRMNTWLSGAYKGSPSGLFVDSWEVETEYIWTPGFGKAFMDEHGYDIEPYMQQLLLYNKEYSDVLYDYMSTLSGYVMREFYTPFAENATANGAFSRAQCGGAPTDLLTAFTLVDIPETEAILYEPSFSKIAASAATLSRKEAVTSETFTCMYGWTGLRYKNGHGQSPHQGEELIADLKLVCDALFANGTNQIIWHGFPFNPVGKTDNWFYTTCQVSSNPADKLTGAPLSAFNKYMADVSRYMRKGHNYSDLAVYIPLEDSWMGGAYGEDVTSKMPWALGQYEMRYILTPEEFKGRQPLWVNGHFLSTAEYRDGILNCGDATFKALYVDVEHLSLESLESILRLAEEGLPVVMARQPKEPGMKKDPAYGSLLEKLYAQPSVSSGDATLPGKPLLEGEDLPDFWCREDGKTLYVFLANPYSKAVSYPMDYAYAYHDEGCIREVLVNHHGKSEKYTLVFHPGESILLAVTPGGIKKIDLGYSPFSFGGDTEGLTGMPLDSIYCRDPFIVADKATKTYYLYRSHDVDGFGGVEAFSSKDLKTWYGPQQVFVIPESCTVTGTVWAPEVHEYEGAWYLFATMNPNAGRDGEEVFRGTQIFRADSPTGPFIPLGNKPMTPQEYMALDGTLMVEDGQPYMVFCHEWVQIGDGTIEVVPLASDLSDATAKPSVLFNASEAPWSTGWGSNQERRSYVTDGCFMYKTREDDLLMLWSSFENNSYCVGIARSESGSLEGPWKQDERPIVTGDGGHSMIFKALDGTLYLVYHQPNSGFSTPKLVPLEDTGHDLRIKQ